jgi:hypothetical protein
MIEPRTPTKKIEKGANNGTNQKGIFARALLET